VDGSSAALRAVRWAAQRAAREGLPLRLAHAYELPLGMPAGLDEEEAILDALRVRGRRWLTEAHDVAAGVAPGVAIRTALLCGIPVSALVRESLDADLVVLGNRGQHALTGLLVGSTALAVAGRAAAPVVLVRDTVTGDGPVVVGVDGTETSVPAVAFAFAEASARRAPLVALHAYTDPTTAAGTLAERLAGWQEKYPDVAVDRELVPDRPSRALRQRTPTAQLVVVGSRGHGLLSGLLGSTSQHLVHHAACPVAVVEGRRPGWSGF
jgi:nucleotide-binding universal stress UspA family protein